MTNSSTRFNEALGHDVRSDPWELQGRSSYVMAAEAALAGQADESVALARLTIQEAREAYDLYALWLDKLPSLLGELGVTPEVLAPVRIEAATVRGDLQQGWLEYGDLIGRFEALVRAGDVEEATEALERARVTWRDAHDPATDQLASLLALGATELGETTVGTLWDSLLGHYYDGIRAKYDPGTRPWSDSVERLALDIFEATRGHLTGPERDGAFEVWEDDDRWVLQFAPCGSGGRTYPGPGGPEAARNRKEFTTEEHDWAWQTKGVCLYCAHCCQLQQRAPIDRIGIPLRVIEPPVLATEAAEGRPRCTWSIYKDPSRLPAHAFTDVGMPIPAWLASDREDVGSADGAGGSPD